MQPNTTTDTTSTTPIDPVPECGPDYVPVTIQFRIPRAALADRPDGVSEDDYARQLVMSECDALFNTAPWRKVR